MLRFSEEIMLLALGDNGEFARMSEWPLHCALAGGVLIDLALKGRIETDPERLFAVDQTPVGDDLLDPNLARVAGAPETFDARFEVRHTPKRGGRLSMAGTGISALGRQCLARRIPDRETMAARAGAWE